MIEKLQAVSEKIMDEKMLLKSTTRTIFALISNIYNQAEIFGLWQAYQHALVYINQKTRKYWYEKENEDLENLGMKTCYYYGTLKNWHIDFRKNGGIFYRFKSKKNATPILIQTFQEAKKLLDTFHARYSVDQTIENVKGYLSWKLVEELGYLEGEAEDGKFSREAKILVNNL